MAAAGRNREGDREIMALTARELEMRQLQRQREQNAWNKETRIQRMENEIADGSARHGIHAIRQLKEAVDYLRSGGIAGLRAHELEVLKRQGDNDFRIAEQKRLGMREQGANAAGLNAEATKYGWDKQLEVEQERQKGGLTLAEKQIASQERIAGMEHGTIGPDGKVTPGSRERVATITGQSAVQQQTEANKGLAAQAEINRQMQQEQIAAQIQRSIIAAGGKADAAKIAGHAKIVGDALRGGSMVGKDPATVMAELAEQYKNDPEMLKSIQTFGGQQQPKKKVLSDYEVK